VIDLKIDFRLGGGLALSNLFDHANVVLDIFGKDFCLNIKPLLILKL